MFRLLIVIIFFISFIMALSSAYLHSVYSPLTICTDFSVCYPQIEGVLTKTYLQITDVIWLIHVISFSLLIVLSSVLLLISFKTKIIRLPSTVFVTLIGIYVQIGLHSEWFITPILQDVAHYILPALMLAGAYYICIHSGLKWYRRAGAKYHYLVYLSIIFIVVQLFLGRWLAINNAGLVCGEFPRCLSSWWPQVDYLSVFNSYLSFSAKVAVHWIHRVISVLNFLSLTLLMLSATANVVKSIRYAGMVLAVLLLAQIATGIAVVKLMMPLWAVILHSLLATVILLPVLAIYFYDKYTLYTEVEREDDSSAVVTLETETNAPVITHADSLYLRLKTQLGKTRTGLNTVLSVVSLGQRKIDQALIEEIETSLIMADVGIEVTEDIINALQEQVEKHQLQDVDRLLTLLKSHLLALLEPISQPLMIPKQDSPYVILVVGVNGVGKTTTIGKLAQRLQREGHSVMLAAGDTFRAAAVEQLQAWGERNHIQVVAQHTGADSASVIFDGLQSAKAKGIDVLIADTAGRLHTKANLMEELKKVKRIMSKLDIDAPHEVLLVLDAGTGQNALTQAEHFNNTVRLTGIALTKLDGTAKGGIIFALAKQLGVPVRFLGVGEGIDDLQDFNASHFIDALFAVDK